MLKKIFKKGISAVCAFVIGLTTLMSLVNGGVYASSIYVDHTTRYYPSGSPGWAVLVKTVDGVPIYCIDETVSIASYGEDIYGTGQSNKWDHLTSDQRDKITKYAYFGYGYNGQNSDEYYVATQALIWKITEGRTVNFYEATDYTQKTYGGQTFHVYDSHNENDITGNITSAQNQILNNISNFEQKADISYSGTGLVRNGDKDYYLHSAGEMKLTDSHSSLNSYSISNNAPSVVSYSKSSDGSVLTVTPQGEGTSTITIQKQANRFGRSYRILVAGGSQPVIEVGDIESGDRQNFTTRVVSPQLSTTARDDVENTQNIIYDNNEVFKDTVSYSHVVPGQKYKVCATLHDIDNAGNDKGVIKDADGNAEKTCKTFTASATSGKVELEIKTNTNRLDNLIPANERNDHKIVVFEELFFLDSGSELSVGSHFDTKDTKQQLTAKAPSIKTTLAEKKDGDKIVEIDKKIVLTDTVEYTNLSTLHSYTLTGELHVRNEDGTDGGVLTDTAGNAITATREFTPSSKNGTVTMDFTFDARSLGGKVLVAFEKINGGGITVTHFDISDEGQTVEVEQPKIRTIATEGEAGGFKFVNNTMYTVINDHISYENLVAGREYEARAELAYIDEDGSLTVVSRGTKTFTASDKNSVVDVKLSEFDSYAYADKELVVLEDVFDIEDEEAKVVDHRETDDKDQTITIINYGFEVQKAGNPKASQIVFTIKDEEGNRLAFRKIADGEYQLDERASEDSYVELHTQDGGAMRVNGLVPGSYILTEVSNGFLGNTLLMKEPVRITLEDSEDGQLGNVVLSSAETEDAEKEVPFNIDDNIIRFTIQNDQIKPEAFLETGGEGNSAYYLAAGGILAVVAVIYAVNKKRKTAE